MAATVTLATTTLAAPCMAGDKELLLTSLAGVTPGVCLYIDRELIRVIDTSSLPVNWVIARRGIDGTAVTAHGGLAVVTIGNSDQFYDRDPSGAPSVAVPVQPWINVRNGSVWVPQGDEEGPDAAARYWRAITTTYAIGALGVRTATSTPSYTGAS